MTYIEINGTRYPATVNGKMSDKDWDGRESKTIKLDMDYDTAAALFVDGAPWSIIQQGQHIVTTEREVINEETGEIEVVSEDVNETYEEVFDNSEFCIAGDITDHRDGTMSVKMGKITDLEAAYEIMYGGI